MNILFPPNLLPNGFSIDHPCTEGPCPGHLSHWNLQSWCSNSITPSIFITGTGRCCGVLSWFSLQDWATHSSSSSVCSLLRVLSWALPRNYLPWEETPFPMVMPLPQGSSHLKHWWEGIQRLRPLAPTWANSDGSSQLQSASWEQLLLWRWWHHSSPPPSASHALLSPPILEAFPGKCLACKSPFSSLFPRELILWYLFFCKRCLSRILILSPTPEYYYGFMDFFFLIQCVIIISHHCSFWMLKFSQIWSMGVPPGWLLCPFHISPLVFEHVLAFCT